MSGAPIFHNIHLWLIRSATNGVTSNTRSTKGVSTSGDSGINDDKPSLEDGSKRKSSCSDRSNDDENEKADVNCCNSYGNSKALEQLEQLILSDEWITKEFIDNHQTAKNVSSLSYDTILQSGRKKISRFIHKICSQPRTIAQNLQRKTALCTRGEALAVSTWKVITPIDIPSQAITVHTLSKYRMNIARLSRVRLSHFRFRAINLGSKQRYCLYHCVVLEDVVVIMSEKARSALIRWKLLNDYMAYACFKGEFWNIISVYAVADDRSKDKFYAELQLLTTPLLKHDKVIGGTPE
ncbi:unnamed protein product [Dracunculus medinensis]|uniref:GRAM domain-containing protein n=1 Tax=Dracunculus medinensis TaxID=318479 RepID=A0A0N4U590_DRAME|nr:unnamed protein product [Dracunculus medinensis]